MKMHSRIENVPKLRTEPTIINARFYNQVRLAQLRMDNPLRIQLSGLRGMDIIFENNSWVCIDRTMYDLPALAWTNFEVSERSGLHLPVQCQLHHYHVHANLIVDSVLDTAYEILGRMLEKSKYFAAPVVAHFPET